MNLNLNLAPLWDLYGAYLAAAAGLGAVLLGTDLAQRFANRRPSRGRKP